MQKVGEQSSRVGCGGAWLPGVGYVSGVKVHQDDVSLVKPMAWLSTTTGGGIWCPHISAVCDYKRGCMWRTL
jgi:hypothetical protein